MRVLIGFILFFPFSALAEKLIYHSPRPEYEIERTAEALSLKTPTLTLKIVANSCNQTVLADFWLSLRKEFEQYPVVRGTPKEPFVDLDGKRRLVIPRLGASELAAGSERFLGVYAWDRQKCRK